MLHSIYNDLTTRIWAHYRKGAPNIRKSPGLYREKSSEFFQVPGELKIFARPTTYILSHIFLHISHIFFFIFLLIDCSFISSWFFLNPKAPIHEKTSKFSRTTHPMLRVLEQDNRFCNQRAVCVRNLCVGGDCSSVWSTMSWSGKS